MAGRDVASGAAWFAVGPVPTGAWNLVASVIMMSFGSRQRDEEATRIVTLFFCFETQIVYTTWAEQHIDICRSAMT